MVAPDDDCVIDCVVSSVLIQVEPSVVVLSAKVDGAMMAVAKEYGGCVFN